MFGGRLRLFLSMGVLLGVLLSASSGAAAEPGTIWSKIDRMTLREKVGQMFVPYVYGESASTTAPADVSANRTLYGGGQRDAAHRQSIGLV